MSTPRRRSPSWSSPGPPVYNPADEPSLPHISNGDHGLTSPPIPGNNATMNMPLPQDTNATGHDYDSAPIGGQAQYMLQEQAYLHRLRSSMADDYYGTRGETQSLGDIDDSYGDLSDAGEEPMDFDDVSQATLQSDDLPFQLDPNSEEDAEKIKERIEWQMMLSIVLTGDIFTSEKTRLASANANNANDEERWFELKAKVTSRSINEQRRLLAVSRPMTHEILERIMNFKIERVHETVYEPFEEVGNLLQLMELCEQMWPNLKVMRENFPVYASPEFQMRFAVLTSWYTVTSSILQELDLLQKWTGNSEYDPTKPPDPTSEGGMADGKEADGRADGQTENGSAGTTPQSPKMKLGSSKGRLSMVSLGMRQEGTLVSTFERHIFRCILPLLERVRTCTLEYSSDYVELGLPHFLLGLSPVISFPVKILRESIAEQLNATKLLQNPASMMIDEEIGKLKVYMELGLKLTRGYTRLTDPVLDKGWIFKRNDTSINDVMLSCIRRYLDLLRKKYAEGGRSSMSFFHSFESIENLENHFKFLQDTCQLIDGGDSSVAEQFSRLLSRVLSRLLSYWEHQMIGPTHFTKSELDRWFPSTIENIRSIQRKLSRFYKILANTYENAADYTFPTKETSRYLDHLRKQGLFLVFGGTGDVQGCYTFATANLRNKPIVIRNLIQGHARPPPPCSNSAESEDPGAIVLVSLSEALRWDGETYQLDAGNESIPQFQGQVRIVAQGGHEDFLHPYVQNLVPPFAETHAVVPRRSHLEKVDAEFHNMRRITSKLATTVVDSAIDFRKRVRKFECQETVQAMFSFAREFGQRGLSLTRDVNRTLIIMKLMELCFPWVEFVSDDCTPTEKRTFKWTVQALEFAMTMTRGTHIMAVREEQYLNLRRRVANCVTLLISHFDIMGARSKAANLTHHNTRPRLSQDFQIRNYDHALVSDDEVIAANRRGALEKLRSVEDRLTTKYNHGKVLDQNNTLIEFLSFAASRLMSTSSMRWQRDEIIGSGGSGNVFKARNLDTFQLMAAKEVRITTTATKVRSVLANIQHEMTALEMVSHPNIVQYYGAELHRDRIFIFMEYCPQGSLATLIGQDGRIEEELFVQLLSLQILEGLAYLHQSGIVHRDIKPENILMKRSVVKIVDFGAAKIIADPKITAAQTKPDMINGTPMYMAPEVIKNDKSAALASVDIWSFGCVILRLITGRLPWSDIDNIFSIMYFIGAHRNPEIPGPDVVSPGCHDVLKQTLQYEPEKRPTSLDLLRHPWFFQARDNLKNLVEQQRLEFSDYSHLVNGDNVDKLRRTPDQSLNLSVDLEKDTQGDSVTTEASSVTNTDASESETSLSTKPARPESSSTGSTGSTSSLTPNAMGQIPESEHEYESS